MLPCFASTAAKSALPLYAVSSVDLDTFLADQPATVAGWLKQTGFKATAGALAPVPGEDGSVSAYVYGTGEGSDALVRAGASAKLPAGRYRLDGEMTDQDALAWAIGTYDFDRYKTGSKKKKKKVPVLELQKGVKGKRASLMAEGVALAQDLINTPAEDMGPEQLEKEVRGLARTHGGKVSVTKGADLLKKGYRLIHAVGRASDEAPRLIDLTWSPAKAGKSLPLITLVGKGVCYDTGGLDLKPSSAMAMMKKDMGGAGNVLGLAHMIMAAGLKVRLRVLIPAVENNVSANSFRTGDVYRSYKGLTVEIGNTDAEGRLVLADALTLADEDKPDMIIDMATLTGAARVALGPELPPFFTDDEELAGELAAAAETVSDPLWRLPLWKNYAKTLNSSIADMRNISDGPFAGAVTAALFLQKFVPNTRSWVHIDMFAWRRTAEPGRATGAELQAGRALFSLLENKYG